MPIREFYRSIRSILRNRHIGRGRAVVKHLEWQGRKALNLFPFEQTLSGSRIIARHRRCGVSALINNQGLYNYNNMNLLKLLLREGGTFFDIGANIGSYTLIASEQEKGAVYAFEPHPVTFTFLKENVDLNRRKNVSLFNLALGAEEGEISLTDEAGSATNRRVHDQSEGAVRVLSRRADAFCMERNVIPNYVKIDVEGFEYDVLVGFGNRLSEVDLWIIEMNGLSDERSKGEGAISDLLMRNHFQGPYYFDFDSRTLSRTANADRDDAVYVSKRLIDSGLFKRIV